MKKQNPIRGTVTNYVTACKKHTKKPRMTLLEFFEDLENRGPWSPNSLFEKWTKKIRANMKKAGTWKDDSSGGFEFVAEYVSRLQRLYRLASKDSKIYDEKIVRGRVVSRTFTREALAFRMIYLKIRVWALRAKRFHLRKWVKRDSYAHIEREVGIVPLDFIKKNNAEEDTFRYLVRPHLEYFFTKEVYKKGALQK